jgi:hypothetical protein
LLVVMRHKGPGARKAAEILNRVEPEFPADLIVRTPRFAGASPWTICSSRTS